MKFLKIKSNTKYMYNYNKTKNNTRVNPMSGCHQNCSFFNI